MARRLSDVEIAARIVPTMLRWPSSELAAWDRLHEGVGALRNMLRVLDNACYQVEQDRHLNPQDIRHRRIQLGDQALGQLAVFKPLHSAERSVAGNINGLETTMQKQLTKALDELREGMAAARRAVVERCQIRSNFTQ